MSKLLNPETEPSVSCGFYNSYGDRKYYAEQMSKIFDGIVNDGVFLSIGQCFTVTARSGNIVTVGTGKCWFDHTWTENDAPLPVDCGEAPTYYNRWDAIVIEMDATTAVRDNSIKVIQGTPATVPVRPTLTKSEHVNQYALCYIYRKGDSTSISDSDIYNVIGTEETPYITAVVDPEIDLSVYIKQWQTQLKEFTDEEKADFTEWYDQMKTLMSDAIAETNAWTAKQEITITNWMDEQQANILEWFNGIKNKMAADDVATNLQFQVDDVNTRISKNEAKQMLMCGFVDGTKTFSDDGTVITSVDSSGRTLVKTFTNNFLTCITVLTDITGSEVGRLVKNFSADGSTISSELTLDGSLSGIMVDWGTN